MTGRLAAVVAIALLLLPADSDAGGRDRERKDIPAEPAALPAKDDSAWDRYLKRAAILKKSHGKGKLNEGDLLKVLRQAGVFAAVSDTGRSGGHHSFATGFRPFKVRVYKGLWRWPLRYGVVSSEFGKRRGGRHKGIDIAADEGDHICAAAPGEVIYSGDGLRGFGNVVILRHDERLNSEPDIHGVIV
ncbi:murein hydrolase activator EnvC family protein, partial [Elusimicrobiota bacterium]